MNKHLHIVMHEVPWPADFGGVTDLYYKLKELHEFGIRIQLHCFTRRRSQQPLLEKYCESVSYYPRKKVSLLSLSMPYIVAGRSSGQLINDLQKDDHPVLLEGIHCTYPLFAGALKNRKVFLRLHNVEYKYYRSLAKAESNAIKKLFFVNEARVLENYERKVAKAAAVWTVSEADAEEYRQIFGAKDVHFLPVFLPWTDVVSKVGRGKYCLYHGNLRINENENAAEWLMSAVFQQLKSIPLIVAGHGASQKLKRVAARFPNIEIRSDLSEADLQSLIENAAINVLPSFNSTGVKLKLLNALFNGRHCIVNEAGVSGSGLRALCSIAETAKSLRDKIEELFVEEFTEEQIKKRADLLLSLYNPKENCRRINAWIW